MPPLKCGVGFYLNRFLDSSNGDFDLLTTSGLEGHRLAKHTFYTADWKIRSLSKLLKTAKNVHYDVVHIQYPAKGYGRQLGINVLPFLLRIFTKSKVVVTLHEYHGSALLGRARNLITVLAAHHVILSNHFDSSMLPKIVQKKSSIIPIGSNIKIERPDSVYVNKLMTLAGFDDRLPVGVFFGFAFPDKGIETLIEAARLAKSQLFILSELHKDDSYHRELLQKISAANNHGAHIYHVGYLSDDKVSKILHASSYFVLPQTIPLTAKSGTAIAAVCHGMVVISTGAQNPILNEPYVHNKNCVLIRPMNPTKLATILQKPPKRAEMSEAIKELAAYFNWGNIYKRHDELYERLIT